MENLAPLASARDLYTQLVETIFHRHYKPGEEVVYFERRELISTAGELGVRLPKNLGDVVYSFKYRRSLPASIQKKSPEGKEWVIVNRGRGRYAFEARLAARIQPDSMLVTIEIPDATPGIVAMHALDDEQALLTRLRYNRLIDIFTGVTCYSLQNHLRTVVPGIGQVETDELYVGVDKKGEQCILPVQAKGGNDELGVVQIEQDIALCEHKFPELTCRAIAAQFIAEDIIALFEFDTSEGEVKKVAERHYKLVPPEEFEIGNLKLYRQRPDQT